MPHYENRNHSCWCEYKFTGHQLYSLESSVAGWKQQSFTLTVNYYSLWSDLTKFIQKQQIKILFLKRNMPTAIVIPVLVTGRPVITNLGEYSKFQQLLNTFQNNCGDVKCTVINPFCKNGTPHDENGNHICCWPLWVLMGQANDAYFYRTF